MIVTNAPQLLAVCDRVQFLKGHGLGEEVASGTHAELMARADYRAAVAR
ncbi:MAG: hypothetical protein HOQ43_07050 [Glycomyces artemisiae]|uniref:Uncharacterized protein n=1 Tax=Glycomyces artemisiae TaxID=1076443 RepID=A0A850C1T2_9ACTN|nr:hypothetical protein [Glycomyces artemisiae]